METQNQQKTTENKTQVSWVAVFTRIVWKMEILSKKINYKINLNIF